MRWKTSATETFKHRRETPSWSQPPHETGVSTQDCPSTQMPRKEDWSLTLFSVTWQAQDEPGMQKTQLQTDKQTNKQKAQMTNKYLRKWSSLVIREIQIKMMSRVHLIWAECLSSRKQITIKRRRNLYTAGGNVNQGSYCANQQRLN